jgi:hypothetical protein
MEIQVGDRFTEQGFEWEVLTHPTTMHGAKTCEREWSAPDPQRPSVK